VNNDYYNIEHRGQRMLLLLRFSRAAMSERDDFLRAICASPDDDTVRLVYADWLEEHGDAVRAEFIRLQCQLGSEDLFAPNRRALLRREWRLLRQHGERWIREDGLADMIAPNS